MKLTVWNNLLVLTRYSKTVTASGNDVVSCRPTVNNSKALFFMRNKPLQHMRIYNALKLK